MTLLAELVDDTDEDAAHAELARLRREVDYWRRLVSARLDLAVACVTGAPEPDPWLLLAAGAEVPAGRMRALVGLDCDPLSEVATLERLRRTLHELDRCAIRLRSH